MDKVNILVAGIGAVGGYFGGLLAHKFEQSDRVEINFLARGQHLSDIQSRGLLVKKGEIEIIAKPTLADDNTSNFGVMDVILVCTKSYDLEETVEQLKPCISDQTIILPLLNGVDSKIRIQPLLKDNLVLDGCVYIFSRLTEPGKVENLGNIQKLFFGLDHSKNEKLEFLQQIFLEAEIEATLSADISTVLWEKYIFVSAIAAATCYYNISIGAILADTKKLGTLTSLITEVAEIASINDIILSENIEEKTLDKIKTLPFGTTSSLHSDYKRKSKFTEVESLIGHVVREGIKYGINTPTFRIIYSKLTK